MQDHFKKILENPEYLNHDHELHRTYFLELFEGLTNGTIRTVEDHDGDWQTNTWVIDGIILALRATKIISGFSLPENQSPTQLATQGVRALVGSHVRPGAFVGSQVVLMPSFVNMGTHIGNGTMIDTWTTVGSGAYVGAHCHISGGVGIGGMLEPRQEKPVIIEDCCFIGSRSILTEGVHIGRGSILAANTTITSGTKIYDTRSGTAVLCPPLIIPAGVMVIPATYQTKTGLARPCVEIVKDVDDKLLKKVGINPDLR